MKPLVIHHSADMDGICSREVARHFLGDRAGYLGYDYGDPLPDLSPHPLVYLIDISLPVEVMREHAAKLVVIDHHKTAIEATVGFTFAGYYCMVGVAACRLAYQWFTQNINDEPPVLEDYLEHRVTEPMAVRLIGEYDVWRRDDPMVDLFQLGIQAEKNPDWGRLLRIETAPGAAHVATTYVADIISAGRAIQNYTNEANAKISVERGFDFKFEGLLFRALNTARCNSLTFTASLRPEHDGCLGYFWDGKQWKFSLYGVAHKPNLDLSVIAKQYGGGGHAQACGGFFRVLPAELGGPR